MAETSRIRQEDADFERITAQGLGPMDMLDDDMEVLFHPHACYIYHWLACDAHGIATSRRALLWSDTCLACAAVAQQELHTVLLPAQYLDQWALTAHHHANMHLERA